jgi:CRP-like cAMP-binding protein
MPDVNLFANSRDQLSLAAGEILFKEGDAADAMYAVLSGCVELVHNGETLDNIEPGGILGELALIDASERSATASALVDSTLARVDRRHFEYLVAEHPTFAIQVMSVMAERLRKANG